MKKIFYGLAFAVFFMPFAAKAAGFYFLPQENSVWSGETIILEVRLDTGTAAANAAEVLINFSKDDAEAVDFLTGGSAIDLWVRKPEISNEKGTVSFMGGATSGFLSDDLLGRLILRSRKEGIIKLNFDKTCRALLANGHGAPLQLENSDGIFTVAIRPLDLPQINSASHPDSNKWNASPNLEVHWDLKSGAEYSYLLSKDPLIMPDETAETIAGGVEYFGLDDGIYYFYLREKSAGGKWGGRATYRAMIDANPPPPFKIFIDNGQGLFQKKYFIAWNAEDKASGTDYYEVCEGKKFCRRAESPYVLQNQWLGEDIIVRAHDKAGHTREAKIKPDMVLPTYTYLSAAIMSLLISIVVFIIIRRRKKNYAQ